MESQNLEKVMASYLVDTMDRKILLTLGKSDLLNKIINIAKYDTIYDAYGNEVDFNVYKNEWDEETLDIDLNKVIDYIYKFSREIPLYENKLNLVDATVLALEGKLNEEKELLTEMSNLIKRKTGLPVNIWVDDIGSNRKVEHNLPRIKMQNDYNDRATENTISILIDKDNPKILAGQLEIKQKDYKKVVQWIKNNFEALDDYWYGRIDIEEFRDKVFK